MCRTLVNLSPTVSLALEVPRSGFFYLHDDRGADTAGGNVEGAAEAKEGGGDEDDDDTGGGRDDDDDDDEELPKRGEVGTMTARMDACAAREVGRCNLDTSLKASCFQHLNLIVRTMLSS